jgi:hypothetical protein
MTYIQYLGTTKQSFEWSTQGLAYRYIANPEDVLAVPEDQVGYLMGFGNFFLILDGYSGDVVTPLGVSGMDFTGSCGVDDIIISADETGRTLKSSGVKLADLGASPGTLIFKGDISTNADFPTTSSVVTGWFYRITANVTDDNPSKTNTGLSFVDGDEVIWVGSTWASTQLPLPANMVTAANNINNGNISVGNGAKGIADSLISGLSVSTHLSDTNNPHATNAQQAAFTPATSTAWITQPANAKDAIDSLAAGKVVVSVNSAGGATFTTLNAAIDYCSAKGGGTIIITEQQHTYVAGTAKNVSNITFIGGGGDQSTGPGFIFWNSGAGSWTGNNVAFKNLLIRARPGSSGNLLTMTGISGTAGSVLFCDHCQFIIDGSVSPSLATSLFNLNSLNCRVYLTNTTCTRAGPGNRSIFSNDGNTEFFLMGRSILTGATPKTVYRDAGSYTLYGTVTTDSLIDSSDRVSYTPADGTKWTDPDPATIKSALDRMAALLVTLNSGNPIP